MVQHSKALWSLFESDIMKVWSNSDDLQSIALRLAVFRHAPHVLSFESNELSTEMYKSLCGSYAPGSPTLLGLRHILAGPHNNALAWHTALAECSPHDPTISGNWIEMLPAFSALDLDPKDQDSWRFWHLLCNSTKDDASGRNLLVALSEAKPLMSQAFASNWSIVDALYDSDDRYERASYSVRPISCVKHRHCQQVLFLKARLHYNDAYLSRVAR